MNLPLQGLKVIEFEGLAPTVFLGFILSDFGAQVTIINRENNQNPIGIDTDQTYLNRGKQSLIINFKNPLHIQILKQMINKADILIDCFRPGVLEKVGIGPQDIQNDKLIYARVTGYGQKGPLSKLAGHDINYLGFSGILSTFSPFQYRHDPPNNILADFAAGGGFGALGILLALYERVKTGKGQTVDISLTHCVAYMGSFLHNMQIKGLWNKQRGQNTLDGGAPFYRTYKCLDNKYLTVGCIESTFYDRFLQGLDIQNKELFLQQQFDQDKWLQTSTLFENIFIQKTRDEWIEIFLPLDCCVGPVLEISELPNRKDILNIVIKDQKNNNFQFIKQPLLTNDQNQQQEFKMIPKRGENTLQILQQYNVQQELIYKYTQQKKPNL
ncbi:hypothetical protein IMG5_204920 [Ichthyophthirius multifiliis]|uniref:Alpha-methylacyl-CoA racemase n=1 Tax=Ichthyophthirius multifiliis TaxID=5932 RepID=G0R6I6_ICHMU|nr:hypothetical protein IMG5_204920 [Ichthyophthirius multifiliis]EGR26917.1 hypothetical protein IMG5_204920 [Ichthyophthirius multifiliis]|eukprot:XP_004023801.1 hypothetical protein IMG5_204920 [Ichthyophthirius multifiliis]